MKIESFSGPYRWLSNFYMVDVEFDGKIYPSTEHAFQAAKTFDEKDREDVRQADTPKLAKKLGKLVKLREDWDSVRLSVMEDMLRKKFENPELRRKLLETGHAELIEGNYWHDTFWGVCDGKGENNLGKLLMKIRDEIRG